MKPEKVFSLKKFVKRQKKYNTRGEIFLATKLWAEECNGLTKSQMSSIGFEALDEWMVSPNTPLERVTEFIIRVGESIVKTIKFVKNLFAKPQPQRKRGFERISYTQWQLDLNGMFTPSNIPSGLFAHPLLNKLPKRSTKHSAGYDVFSPFDFTLAPGEDIKIPTGFKAYMLEDEYLVGHVRSSLGFKGYLRLANTTAIGDSDYYNNTNNEGHYFIKIRNEGDKSITVKKDEAFAQVIFQKYLLADDDDFTTGEERIGGIGSTNK